MERRKGIVPSAQRLYVSVFVAGLLLGSGIVLAEQMVAAAVRPAPVLAKATPRPTLLDISGQGAQWTDWVYLHEGRAHVLLEVPKDEQVTVLLWHEALLPGPLTLFEGTTPTGMMRARVAFHVPGTAQYAIEVRGASKWRVVVEQ